MAPVRPCFTLLKELSTRFSPTHVGTDGMIGMIRVPNRRVFLMMLASKARAVGDSESGVRSVGGIAGTDSGVRSPSVKKQRRYGMANVKRGAVPSSRGCEFGEDAAGDR